jgi:hypothetical protein
LTKIAAQSFYGFPNNLEKHSGGGKTVAPTGMYKVMTIRRFVRDQDDREWAELANIHQAESHKSM